MALLKISLPKGVFDIFPYVEDDKHLWKRSSLWLYVESVVRQLCKSYGFAEIRTPVFEKTEVFLSVGESSDIVNKEMYTFADKKGRSLTLRPEGTAAVMRSLVDHATSLRDDNKFYYLLPMFRYERQQAGRYRQHHQFGVEAIGVRNPFRDAEILSLLWDFYTSLGIKNVCFQVNSLGSNKTRSRYNQVLRNYFQSCEHELSSLSKERLAINVLRILDSKEPEDQVVIQNVPSIFEYIDEEDLQYFEAILRILDSFGIPYATNPRLVRGLDYYTDLVFEAIITHGAHAYAIGGGGRYDGLSAQFGCEAMPACGFGVGLERVIRTLIEQKIQPPQKDFLVRLIPTSATFDMFCCQWARDLREKNIPVEVDWFHKKLKTALKTASAEQVPFVCIVGEQEMLNQIFTIKNMALHEEFSGSKQEIEQRLLYEIQNTSL